MPEFGVGAAKSATIVMKNPTAKAWDYTAELYLGTGKATTSGLIPFSISANSSVNVEFPITMPSTEGVYTPYIDVFSKGALVGAYQGIEDVVIVSLGPTIINPSFEAGLSPWVFETNYGGRSDMQVKGASWLAEYGVTPYEGNNVLSIFASPGGRRIVMTLTQAIPWSDSYRGLPINISVRANTRRDGYAPFTPSTLMCVEIDDGISISSSPPYTGGVWEKLTASKVLASNATKLDMVLRCEPDPGAGSRFLTFFDKVELS